MKAVGADRHPVGRAPTNRSSDTGSVALTAASPTYIDGEGNTDSFEHQFMVPPGADYLNGDITWNAQSKGTAVFETLFDPLGPGGGVLAARHGPQRVRARRGAQAERRHVDRGDLHRAQRGSVHRRVQFKYASERFHASGSVSPASRTLAPGQTGTFHVNVTPDSPATRA